MNPAIDLSLSELLFSYISAVIQPDFMQVICLSAGIFILPLQHRPHWKRRFVLITLGFVMLSSTMTVAVWAMYSNASETGSYWEILVQTALVQAILYLLGIIAYYAAPLAAAFCLMRSCTCLEWPDVLYGTACAYAVQHISFCASVILFGEDTVSDLPSWIGNWILALLVMIAAYYLLAIRFPMDGSYHVSPRKAFVMAGIILAIGMLMNIPARSLQEAADNEYIYAICMGYDLLSCVFILWSQTEQRREVDLQASIQAEQRLRLQMQEQYDLSRENIDLVNRKCHDLKHQIAALRLVRDPNERESGLKEIEEAVMIYDAVAQTGNEVLDTVLTEKSLLCEQNQISWTCMADGEVLQFIPPVDLYTLFGNALDNAIEASAQISDPDHRHISVTVRESHGAALIQVENYCAQAPELRDGLPQTTKEDKENHGFGMRSIREITQRYDGTMDISVRDDIFLLSILIPIPQEKGAS